jgi:hypothetical protein
MMNSAILYFKNIVFYINMLTLPSQL